MGMGLKIGIVGAGSVTFIASLIRDLAVTEGLHGSLLSLMDINPERLNMSYALARRYFEELGVDIKVEKTLDRRECIRDSDFVVNLAFPIGYQGLEEMIRVAEEHGYYRGIDATEWNMVNTYPTFTAYKQYRLALDIARDMEELASDAWLIQVSNPVLETSTLLYRTTKVKVIGYCHGAVGGLKLLASRALDIDFRNVEFSVAGFNHVVFLTELKYEGEDAYPLIDRWIEEEAENFWATHVLNPWEETLSRAAVDMYKLYGLYPLGDTARSGTWKYHWSLKTKQRWYGLVGGVDSEIGWVIRILLYQKSLSELRELAFKHGVTRRLPPGKSGEAIVDLIDSLTGGGEKRLVLNVPNSGIIPGLPSDVYVEVPVKVRKGLLEPEPVKQLPKRLYGYVLYPRLERLEWALEAFMAGEKRLLVDILMRDPRTRSEQQARRVIDALLNLPFNSDLKKHYVD